MHCSKLLQWRTPQSLNQLKQLHAQMILTGAILSPPSAAHLLNSAAAATSPSLTYALNVFEKMPQRPPSTFLYNSLMKICYTNGNPKQSQDLFAQMRVKDLSLDSYTFKFLFKSCGALLSIEEGLLVHGLFIKHFSEVYNEVGSSLIKMYVEFNYANDARRVFDKVTEKDVFLMTTMIGGLVKLGLLDEARKVFDVMRVRNVVTWTTMISGYSQDGRAKEAVEIFKNMVEDNVMPDTIALISVLSACAQLKDLKLGMWILRFTDLESMQMNNNFVVALIDMYAKCGDIVMAYRTFDSIGRKIPQAWNAVIDGYCKIGDVDSARHLFDLMDSPDLYAINSMITGYVQSSRLREALQIFQKLRFLQIMPDKFTIVALLTTCASLGVLDHGKSIHAYLEASAIGYDIFIGTALVDMYGKCGRMDQAMLVFNSMSKKDVLTWTTLVSGLAMNGKGKLALEYFDLMQKEQIIPNSVAYIGVLNACSHSGLIEEGKLYFSEMKIKCNIEPEIEHYGVMVDLLGRGGRLNEAMELIESMPMQPNPVIWASFLRSCRVSKNIDLAEKAAKNLLALEPTEDAVYVQLGNVYVDMGRRSDASKIRDLMDMRRVKKIAAYSSITISGHVHKFISNDCTHPEITDIQLMMAEMLKKLKLAGYRPMTSHVMLDVNEEDKEQAVFAHSEKMAIAYGIMRLGANLPIHVIKNVRVCEDCHVAIKLISKIWNRNIILRDRSRFHHFQDGNCSCNDFW